MDIMKITSNHSLTPGRHAATQKAWEVEVDGRLYATDAGIRGESPAMVTVHEDGTATVDLLRSARSS